ncbi:MAG: AAA family ATPase [Oscillospiraceae bacterium]|nr:AAA family ATPase [Oscillospiraceae bacterium]
MTMIPIRFRREIQMHLLNNYASATKKSTPLILGIDGRPGDGKTFQCNEVLRELGCNVVSLSASDFGSMYESNAANYIVEKYREAATQPMPVLILNDIDTAIGEWGHLTQYTANRQFVLNELMHLCDFPENPHDIPANRVPIIMTGNDFKKIYAPLVRFGRMKHFEWIPTNDERLEIIYDILYPLPPTTCNKIFDESEKHYVTIVRRKRNINTKKPLKESLPIAFYSQLRMEIINKCLSKDLDELGWHQTYSKISAMEHDLYDKAIDDATFSDIDILEILKCSIEKYVINSFV